MGLLASGGGWGKGAGSRMEVGMGGRDEVYLLYRVRYKPGFGKLYEWSG